MKTERILPFWLESAQVRQTPCAWIVSLTARTHGRGHGSIPATRKVRIPIAKCENEDQALCRSMSTPTGWKVRTLARGCWLLTHHREKHKDCSESYSEMMRIFAANMRAKYDGINYLYESEEAQDELIRILKLTDIVAMNYPVGLVAHDANENT